MNKLLIICGPTAAGKTDLGIKMAKKYNGEIVSADSRQVYKGMDIISGKDLPQNSKLKTQNSKLGIENNQLLVGFREKDDIPVWLVDIVEPDYPFNVGEYSLLAKKVIEDIWSRDKLPIVVGGSGLYIKSIVDPIEYLLIPPNNKLRKELEGENVEFLQQKLSEIDKEKWECMNQSDRNNPRRLIRAIEVAVWRKNNSAQTLPSNFIKADKVLWIGLRVPSIDMLYPKIDQRVENRLKEGAIAELKNLASKKYSWYLSSMNACGLRQLKEFIEGKETLIEATKRWKFHERDYARRQMIWFKKDKRIVWFDITDSHYLNKIDRLVERWYND